MNQWSSGDIVVNGIKLHYERTGGPGPTVVLAHGITDSRLDWGRLAQALEQDYDLVMYDARGHGLSDAPGTGYTRKTHAADLAGLVDALGLDRPALIGHSMGAANVATALATYPDLACGAILEDPPWREVDPTEEPAQQMAERAKSWRAELVSYKDQSIEEISDRAAAKNPTWSKAVREAWAKSRLRVDPDVLDWLFDMIPFSEWEEIIRQIQVPTLVITGDPDLGAIVTPEVAQAATELNSEIEVTHIEDAGHSIRREQFAPYLSAVRAFLADLFG